MGVTSEYWYEKKEMPKDAKKRIRCLVKGTVVREFMIGKKRHRLVKVDGSIFREVFMINRAYLYKGDYTAPPDENDYLESDNYLSEDGLAGFSITTDGWLVSLYSNYVTGGFAKAIRDMVIGNAYKLVCIVGGTDEGNKLIELYRKLYGFKKYVTTINDTNIMRKYYGDEFIDLFVLKHGRPFHVFMIAENAVCIGRTNKRFFDYFEAEKYVNETVMSGSS